MTAKQKRITPRTPALMEERKQLKALVTRFQEDKERYKMKDKYVRHACEEDKKYYLEGICVYLQDGKHSSQAGMTYNYIREMKKHSRCAAEPSNMLKIDLLMTPTRSEKYGVATQNQCTYEISDNPG